MKIPAAFVSRVSNQTVRERAGCKPLSDKLLEQQMILLGKVLRAPLESPLQRVSLIPGTLQAATYRFVRRVGRPRREWVPSVLREVYKHGGLQDILAATETGTTWKRFIKRGG